MRLCTKRVHGCRPAAPRLLRLTSWNVESRRRQRADEPAKQACCAALRAALKTAELAGFEPAEDVSHGVGAYGYVSLERVIEGGYGEEDEGDDQGERGNHEEVDRGAVQAEKVGESHHNDPSGYEHHPEDGRQSLL